MHVEVYLQSVLLQHCYRPAAGAVAGCEAYLSIARQTFGWVAHLMCSQAEPALTSMGMLTRQPASCSWAKPLS